MKKLNALIFFVASLALFANIESLLANASEKKSLMAIEEKALKDAETSVNSEELNQKENYSVIETDASFWEVERCTGEFTIDGVSFTITIYDVSLWDCIRFKVASWFN